MKILFLALISLALFLVPLPKHPPASLPASQPPNQDIRVVWDKYGVPHIYSPTDEGAYYGLGYACAKDRLFQMTFYRLVVQGRLREFFDDDPITTTLDEGAAYLEIDKEMHTLGLYRQCQETAAHMAAKVISDPTSGQAQAYLLLAAYVKGINDYVQPLGQAYIDAAGVPKVLKSIPLQNFQGWTVADTIGLWMRFSRFGPMGVPGDKVSNLAWYTCLTTQHGLTPQQAAQELLHCNRVFDEAAASVQRSDLPAGLEAAITAYASCTDSSSSQQVSELRSGMRFSQGWAVGGSRMQEGQTKAVLFGHPQLAFGVPTHFWEASMAGATFHVRGAFIPGTANIFVGSNGYVAWTATKLGMDQEDLFGLQVVNDQYLLGSNYLSWDVDEQVQIKMKGVPPSQWPFVRYRECIWGPVVSDYVDPWPAPTDKRTFCSGTEYEFGSNTMNPYQEYAVKSPLYDKDRDPSIGFMRAYRSRTANSQWPNPVPGDFREAIWDVSYMSFNCVFADADGVVGYTPVGDLPLRSCSSPMGGFLAQDGRTLASQWRDIVPADFKPWVEDPASGYAYSANHLPVGAWYPIAFVSHGGHTSRARRLRERLELLPPGATTTSQVIDIYRDDVYTRARDVTELADWVETHPPTGFSGFSSNALDALSRLRTWRLNNTEGHLNSGLPNSTLAISAGGVPFDPSYVSAAKTALFGQSEEGLEWWLRCKTNALHGATPCDCPTPAECTTSLTLEEALYLESLLCDAWGSVGAKMWNLSGSSSCPPPQTHACPPGSGDPCPQACASGPAAFAGCGFTCDVLEGNWQCWFDDIHLKVSRRRWGMLFNGLPNLMNAPEGTPPNEIEPVIPVTGFDVTFGHSLYSQGSQSYSQSVPLGPSTSNPNKDRAKSLLPLGQSDDWNSADYDSQKGLWSSGGLKVSPIRESLLECPTGGCNVVLLRYP